MLETVDIVISSTFLKVSNNVDITENLIENEFAERKVTAVFRLPITHAHETSLQLPGKPQGFTQRKDPNMSLSWRVRGYIYC